MAKESFRFMPPLSSFANLFWCSVSITSSMISAIFEVSAHFSSQTSVRCSRTVKSSKRTSNYWHRPRLRLKLFTFVFNEYPSTSTSPPVGAIIPVIIWIAVVFPAPLWPNNAITSP